MADYSFFMMGVFALVAAGVVGAVCILLTIACIITARKTKRPLSFVGTDLKGTAVSYSGEDPRLAGHSWPEHNLTSAQVGPILREWGYKYDIDQAQPSGCGGGKPAPHR